MAAPRVAGCKEMVDISKKVQRLWLLFMSVIITGCILSNDLRSDLDEEHLVAYDFAVALLQHDPIAYELVSPTAHDYLDEWFASTKASKCYSPQMLSGGVTWEEEIGKVEDVTILCQGGSDPICGRIEIEALYFSEQIVDNESTLAVEDGRTDHGIQPRRVPPPVVIAIRCMVIKLVPHNSFES